MLEAEVDDSIGMLRKEIIKLEDTINGRLRQLALRITSIEVANQNPSHTEAVRKDLVKLHTSVKTLQRNARKSIPTKHITDY